MSRTVHWVNPTSYEDGTPYSESDNKAYEIKIDDQPAVDVPVKWATEFDLETLESFKDLKRGNHTVALAVVDTEGQVSDFSAPATFPVSSRPIAPTITSIS